MYRLYQRIINFGLYSWIGTTRRLQGVVNTMGITNHHPGDYPIIFAPDIAVQKHQKWSDYAKYVCKNNRSCRKVPQLDHE
jgi:hypothetical protein